MKTEFQQLPDTIRTGQVVSYNRTDTGIVF
jgi:hypothetical protein